MLANFKPALKALFITRFLNVKLLSSWGKKGSECRMVKVLF